MQRIVGIFLCITVFMLAWGALMSGQVEAAVALTAPQQKVVTIVRTPEPLVYPPVRMLPPSPHCVSRTTRIT